MADDYSPPVSGGQKEQHGLGREALADLPDLQLPERGMAGGAVSIRAAEDLDLAELITTLRDAGAEIVAINTFPATRGEPSAALPRVSAPALPPCSLIGRSDERLE